MPNWVMNELTCIFQTSEEYNAFKTKVTEKNNKEEEEFFNIFVTMPEVLNGTQSPDVNVTKLIADFNKETGKSVTTLQEIVEANHQWFSSTAKAGIQNRLALASTGFSTWHEWNVKNWGVKWDASDLKIKELPDFNTVIYSFNTPWDTPESFVKTLSTLYPNATFEMVSGSIENDTHYEFTCEDGKFEETCSYETFKEAVEDGKWGGMKEWAILFEESEEIDC